MAAPDKKNDQDVD